MYYLKLSYFQAYDNEILLIGGIVEMINTASTTIFSYVADAKRWEVRNESLQTGRHEHVAFLVPDDYCEDA